VGGGDGQEKDGKDCEEFPHERQPQ
jgi:hypothetical protein